jgi:hypothetical protein
VAPARLVLAPNPPKVIADGACADRDDVSSAQLQTRNVPSVQPAITQPPSSPPPPPLLALVIDTATDTQLPPQVRRLDAGAVGSSTADPRPLRLNIS